MLIQEARKGQNTQCKGWFPENNVMSWLYVQHFYLH